MGTIVITCTIILSLIGYWFIRLLNIAIKKLDLILRLVTTPESDQQAIIDAETKKLKESNDKLKEAIKKNT